MWPFRAPRRPAGTPDRIPRMITRLPTARLAVLCVLVVAMSAGVVAQPNKYARDPKQLVDEDYTKKIQRVHHASRSSCRRWWTTCRRRRRCRRPRRVLGDIAGAPGKLPYTAEVHEYMRMLEKAAPGRVKVFSIGKSEEGREMIAVAIAAEPVLSKLDENRARLAKLADPRTIKLDDAEADRLVETTVPVYYITGAIHAPETGAPDGADGAGLPAGRRREPVHQGDPQQRHHADHADCRDRRARSPGRHLQAGTWRIPKDAWPSARLLGQVRRCTTTTATRWAPRSR